MELLAIDGLPRDGAKNEQRRLAVAPSARTRRSSAARFARTVIELLPMPLHASAYRALRQAWELYDTDKAERLFAISLVGLTRRRPVPPPASSKGSTRC